MKRTNLPLPLTWIQKVDFPHKLGICEKLFGKAIVANDAPLVFLSRIERIKGAHTAIAKKSGKRLIIAGNYSETGEAGKYWHEEIKPLLGKDNIEYVGTVNDEQKNNLLGKALAMIVPIEWEEPFGIVFAEALACGTPVISCPRGSLPEIVQEGLNGYLIADIDEGVRTVNQVSQIDRARCRQSVVGYFSSNHIVEQYELLYKSSIEII